MLRMVTVEHGQVQGLPAADPRITSFKGIPFAAPPVGENRWRAPSRSRTGKVYCKLLILPPSPCNPNSHR